MGLEALWFGFRFVFRERYAHELSPAQQSRLLARMLPWRRRSARFLLAAAATLNAMGSVHTPVAARLSCALVGRL